MKQLLRWIPSPKRPFRLHTAFQPWLRWTGFWYCKMGSSSKTAPIANCSPPGNITRPYGGCRAEVFCRVENALALCLIPFSCLARTRRARVRARFDALVWYHPHRGGRHRRAADFIRAGGDVAKAAVAGCADQLPPRRAAAHLYRGSCADWRIRRAATPARAFTAHSGCDEKAVLAIEDARFYAHGGVDYLGIVRAGLADLVHGGASQGASTITMQLARNFFLTSEKTYTRKLYEALLAWRIESALSKDQILEIYMNQIYLGQRAYGFAVAARVYFGKELKEITLAQAAMLAGLPKAPSAFNPIVNPVRAKARQAYILKRMLGLRYIDQAQYETALNENLNLKGLGKEFRVPAQYVAEMVRNIMVAQYRD